MNPFTKLLEDLGSFSKVLIILALMAALCAVRLAVLMIAYFADVNWGVLNDKGSDDVY